MTGAQPIQPEQKNSTASQLIGVALTLLGALFFASFQIVALVPLAYGVTMLASRKNTGLAFGLVVLGALCASVLSFSMNALPPYSVSLVSVLSDGTFTLVVCVLAAATCLVAMHSDSQIRFLLLAIAISVGTFAIDAGVAASAGTTVWGEMQAAGDELMAIISSSSGGQIDVSSLEEAWNISIMIWPFSYFFQGVLFVALVRFVSRLACKRFGVAYNDRPFWKFDIAFGVLIPVIAGIVCLIVSSAAGDHSAIVQQVGVNLLMCARVLLVIQGLAVLAGVMQRMNWSTVIKALVIAVFLFMEMSFLVLALIGLVDLWINFRKLPRRETASEEQNDIQQ